MDQCVSSQKHLLQILRPVHLRRQALQRVDKLPPVGVNLRHARQAAAHHVEAVAHAGFGLGESLWEEGPSGFIHVVDRQVQKLERIRTWQCGQ